ncbi:MAG: DUF4846 domain-containing protein [Marinilabiliaceae bacterium]|nr:DUF4846 domain-containing protein [Marinilabiliaceae bacterium]
MKIVKRILFALVIITVLVAAVAAWIVFGYNTSNPHNYATIAAIPTPTGYERIDGNDKDYVAYLRALPLKHKGSEVQLYTGGNANWQSLCYAVADLPLLSNSEQCADVCMRIRAEAMYVAGRYNDIHFQDVNGKTHTYKGGKSRAVLEKYLRRVYGVANTYSLCSELKQRKLSDMQPGDIFVYPARKGKKYGHAVMVVDVAQNPQTKKKAFLLVEGNTPAREMHVMRNFLNPFSSPWFELDEEADNMILSVFHYEAKDLRHF